MPQRVSALLIAAILLAAPAAEACTTFCSRGLFGRNYDFPIGYGMVMVNKRGVSKSASGAGNPARWTSRFGSVTFNQFGRDNPMGGMNERGLVVELMWLDGTRYPDPDARPETDCLEWIQYQLDLSASVEELIANAAKVRITQQTTPIHFLASDRGGDVAALEFLDGKLVVHRGDKLPVPVLANDTYADSLARYRRGATDRFARAAKMIAKTMSVDHAFAVLAEVGQGPSTQWSIVYDQRDLTIHYKTRENPARRHLRLAALDFSCGTPVKVLDVDRGRGDVAAQFADYTTNANLALLKKSVRGTSFLADTPEATIVKWATHPESARCAR